MSTSAVIKVYTATSGRRAGPQSHAQPTIFKRLPALQAYKRDMIAYASCAPSDRRDPMLAHWCADVLQSASDRLLYALLLCLQSEQYKAVDDLSKSRWLSLVLAGIKAVLDPSLSMVHKVFPAFW